MSIRLYGEVNIPQHVRLNADTIKLQNYKTNSPKKFQKTIGNDLGVSFNIAKKIDVHPQYIDWVYFSCCNEAEPHVDNLDPLVYGTLTYIIPIILPEGNNILTVNDVSIPIQLNNMYSFNHQDIHRLDVENYTGCVVLMASVKQPQWVMYTWEDLKLLNESFKDFKHITDREATLSLHNMLDHIAIANNLQFCYCLTNYNSQVFMFKKL